MWVHVAPSSSPSMVAQYWSIKFAGENRFVSNKISVHSTGCIHRVPYLGGRLMTELMVRYLGSEKHSLPFDRNVLPLDEIARMAKAIKEKLVYVSSDYKTALEDK